MYELAKVCAASFWLVFWQKMLSLSGFVPYIILLDYFTNGKDEILIIAAGDYLARRCLKRMKSHHVHDYCTETTFDQGHSHRMYGATGYEIPFGNSHVHSYYGVTTVNNAHIHHYSGITGPAIPLAEGGHTHEYQGPTTVDLGHRHYFKSLTSAERYSRFL